MSCSRVCERADTLPIDDNLVTYVCSSLVRHLIESDGESCGCPQIEAETKRF